MGKMTLDTYVENHDYYTSKASEVSRALSLGGIAAIWLLKNPEGQLPILDNTLFYSLTFLCLSLGLDLLQYLVGSFIWRKQYDKAEARIDKGLITQAQLEEEGAPNWIKHTIDTIFYLKLVVCMTAFVFLMVHLFPMLNKTAENVQ